MRYYLISVLAVLVTIAVVGCNPVGMEDTKAYVTGLIFTDSSRTAFAENIGIMTLSTPETYITSTGADGRFWIEIQMYPDTASSSSGSTKFGLKAYNGSYMYVYGGGTGSAGDTTFTVSGGDTLNLYDIDLDMFSASTSMGFN